MDWCPKMPVLKGGCAQIGEPYEEDKPVIEQCESADSVTEGERSSTRH